MNTTKLLPADASWEAVNVEERTFGGYGLDAKFDAEREFREVRLYRVASISAHLTSSCLAGHDIGLPRSV